MASIKTFDSFKRASRVANWLAKETGEVIRLIRADGGFTVTLPVSIRGKARIEWMADNDLGKPNYIPTYLQDNGQISGEEDGRAEEEKHYEYSVFVEYNEFTGEKVYILGSEWLAHQDKKYDSFEVDDENEVDVVGRFVHLSNERDD